MAKRFAPLTMKQLRHAVSFDRLSPKDRRHIGRTVLPDFKKFCVICEPPVYDWGEPENAHDKIADHICSVARGPDGKLRIYTEAPRGFGKSSEHQRHQLWRTCRSAVNWRDEPYKDGSIRILHCAPNTEACEEGGSFVLQQLSESNLTKVFGGFSSRKEWGVSKLTIRQRKNPDPQPTWSIGTVGKSTTRRHPDLLYVDDVETEESTRKLGRMLTTRSWFGELSIQVEANGEIRVNGTRRDENDLYGHILTQEDLWQALSLTVENSTCSWRDADFIEGARRELSPHEFAAAYLNNPWTSELSMFKKEWFRPCELNEDIRSLPRYILADIAGSEQETSCETALWVVAVDHMGTVYCLDLVHGHWNADAAMEHLRVLFEKWKARWFVIENRVLTSWALPAIRLKERESGVHMPWRVASGKGYRDKDTHIGGLEPLFRNARIFFADSMPAREIRFVTLRGKVEAQGPLVNTFVRFPRAKLKDVPDALAYVQGRDADGASLCPAAPRRRNAIDEVRRSRNPWKQPRFSKHGSFGDRRQRERGRLNVPGS